MSLSPRLSFTTRLPIAYMGLMLVSMGSFGALSYRLSQDRTAYLEYTFELLAVALAAVSAAGFLGWLFARSIAGPLAIRCHISASHLQTLSISLLHAQNEADHAYWLSCAAHQHEAPSKYLPSAVLRFGSTICRSSAFSAIRSFTEAVSLSLRYISRTSTTYIRARRAGERARLRCPAPSPGERERADRWFPSRRSRRCES